jgi:large subunit ribosomal protein L33
MPATWAELPLAEKALRRVECRVYLGLLGCAERFSYCCGDVRAMAKSKKKVETVFLVCEETGDYNYTLRRKPGGEKLKLSKFCPRLRKHTLHVEKKK